MISHMPIVSNTSPILNLSIAGQIPSLKNVMQALRNNAGFFIDVKLFDRLLTEAGER